MPGSTRKVNLNKEVQSFLTEELSGKAIDTTINMSDFNKIKEEINTGINEKKMMKELERLEGDDKEFYGIEIARQYQELKKMLPVNLSQTLFGVDDRDPSDYEKNKFLRSVRVLQDPSYVIELMKSGALTGTEVDAMQVFYPTLLEGLQASILDNIASRQGKGDLTISRKKNHILSLILGVSRITPETFQMLQNNLTPQEETNASEFKLDTTGTMADVQQTLTR